MLMANPIPSFAWAYRNWGANAGVDGVTFTGGGANYGYGGGSEGSYLQVAANTDITNDVYWINIACMSTPYADNYNGIWLKLGVDPAGGTSYSAVVDNLLMSPSAASDNSPTCQTFSFPLYIPAGSSIAARLYGAHDSSPPTCYIRFTFYGQPSARINLPTGAFTQCIGAPSNIVSSQQAVGFTPGASGAWGSWQVLDATALSVGLWWWQLGVMHYGVAANEYNHFELAWSADATNYHTIMKDGYAATAAELMCPAMYTNNIPFACYCPVPAGAKIYIRGKGGDASPLTGYQAMAMGVGG